MTTDVIKTDERGVEYVENGDLATLPSGWALCGTCGRAWNDEKSTEVTPAPSGRCPFEYEHGTDEDDTVDTALDKQSINALRQADDVYAHFYEGRHYLTAIKRVPYAERERHPFADDKHIEVAAEGSIQDYGREYTSEHNVVACHASLWASRGIWQIVRPGDRLRLRWSRGGHTSDNLRNAGLVGDSLVIEVIRKGDVNGRKPLAFLADTYVGPDNTARMTRTTRF